MPSDDIEENIILNQLSNEKLSKAEKHDLIQKLNENNNVGISLVYLTFKLTCAHFHVFTIFFLN